MSVWEHSRFAVWNRGQHPYSHTLSDFHYANGRLPGVNNAQSAIDYVVAVLYPNYIGTFATVAALPGSANQNDYAVVSDDGDGKAAGYVWSVIDGASRWIKRYDFDWSVDGIIAEAINKTQYMYVHKYGFTDKDASGNAITGLYAGQKLFGGDKTTQNLTFNANSFDDTGYVQTDNHFRPTSDNSIDLGTSSNRWRNAYIGALSVGTFSVASGSLTDASGAISFGSNNLSTTGNITCANLTATSSASVGTLRLSSGSVTDTSGAISFGSTNLTTTGTLKSGQLTVNSDLTLGTGSITSASGQISFGSNALVTTGTLQTGNITAPRLDVGNIRLYGNTISVLNTNGNLIVQANGTGVVDIQSPIQTLSQSVTGTVSITGQLNIDYLRLDGNVISSTNLNGNITITPNGSGLIEASSGVFPTTNAAQDLGRSGNSWKKLWLSGSIGGATEITLADLLTLRDVPYRDTARTQQAQNGDTLFWDSSNQVWLANHPDTEITHSELTGITSGDAGHTQFVMLAGRAGGQAIQGGVAASENLILESTSNATKGKVYTKDGLSPYTNASFASSWSGLDLGDGSHYFRDVYSKGQFKGFRLESFTSITLPTASAANTGHAVYSTDDSSIYVDAGGSWVKATCRRFVQDISWSGSQTQQTVTVSSSISDARNAIWQLKDNNNNYEVIFPKIEAISATQVRITANVNLPAGSYRLVGIE